MVFGKKVGDYLKLTIKQKKFADEYIISGNAEKAAIKAGYSEKYARGNAHKLVANSCIKTYIEERMSELEDQAIAKQNEILKYMTSVMRGESKTEAIVTESKGDGISEARIIKKGPDEKDRIKAGELLGKMYSLWTEKNEVSIKADDGFLEALTLTAKSDWDDEEDG